MALIGSLGSGVSAMKSFVTGMEVIGDNISNSKTVGYKRQRVNYSDNFSDTLREATPGNQNSSNTPPIQIGSGVNVSAAQKLMLQGSVERTGVESDMAISGKGFFRVLNQASGEQFLTRDGSFRLDQDGYLADKSGNYLLGLTGGTATNEPNVLGRIQVNLASDIKVDANGRPQDASGRIVLADGTRALANSDSDTGFYRVDEDGRLLNAQNGDIILGDLDNNSTTTEFARWNDATNQYELVNQGGNLIDEFGNEIRSFDPRGNAPTGALEPTAGTVFNAYNADAGAAYQVNANGNYVDGSGNDLGVTFDPTVAPEPVSPDAGIFNVFNKADGEFYQVNSDGNYVDSSGAEIGGGVAFDPAASAPSGAVQPTPGTIYNAYNAAEGEFYQVNADGNYVDANGIDLGEAFDTDSSPAVAVVGPPPGDTFMAFNAADSTFYQVNANGNYVDANGTDLQFGFDPNATAVGVFPGAQPTGVTLNAFNRADGAFYQINENGNYVDDTGAELTYTADPDGAGPIDVGDPIAFDATTPFPSADASAAAEPPAAGSTFNAYNSAEGGFYQVNANGNYVNAAGNLLGGVAWDEESQPIAAPGSTGAVFAEYNPNSPGAGAPQVAIADPNDPNQFKMAIQSWSVNKDGEVTLSLNDGSTYTRGQLMLQQVLDEDSLVEQGNGLYSGINNAGAVGLDEWNLGSTVSAEDRLAHDPNQGGAGFIQSRALEGSNTDLTEEFSNMITTQRAFQGGSKLITVSDEILQEIINLKR